MLQSQVKAHATVKQNYKTENGQAANELRARRLESKSIDYGMGSDSTLRNSISATAKRQMKPVDFPKVSESEQRVSLQSSKKSIECRDVDLKDMLDVPDEFSLQSPLPFLDNEDTAPRYSG
jgi:phenylalanyl-tRNA synthetase beta subunit